MPTVTRGHFEHDTFPTRQFKAFGTTAFVATVNPDAITDAEVILREEVAAIDAACSRFRPDSELAEAHRSRNRPIVVSKLLAEAVEVALRVATETDGVVDPTVGAALIALGYDRDFALLSDGPVSDRGESVPARGWRSIEFDAESRRLWIPDGVTLDLGATAKALAADHAASLIADVTGSGVIVNLGGDISIEGAPSHGWAIGLALSCATSPNDADVVVALHRGGLASSGTAVRTWRHGDRQVHHIIDPSTGESAPGFWNLVSVAASSCVEANALSTASIVWGDEALRHLASFTRPARLVRYDGVVVTVNGWPAEPSAVGASSNARA
jgi:thiamine biosynthesis lipoprotein